jgi:hypothetical protein
MWRRVDFVWTDVSEEPIASIFRVEKYVSEELAWAGGCSWFIVLSEGKIALVSYLQVQWKKLESRPIGKESGCIITNRKHVDWPRTSLRDTQ